MKNRYLRYGINSICHPAADHTMKITTARGEHVVTLSKEAKLTIRHGLKLPNLPRIHDRGKFV